MRLLAGQKLASAVSGAQVVVVRAPDGEVDLACDGLPMLEDGRHRKEGENPTSARGEGLLVGKRYADERLGLELLCTRAGAGLLTSDGRPLELKAAKPLPSSD